MCLRFQTLCFLLILGDAFVPSRHFRKHLLDGGLILGGGLRKGLYPNIAYGFYLLLHYRLRRLVGEAILGLRIGCFL